MDGAVSENSHGSGQCAEGRGGLGADASDGGAAPISGQLAGAILGSGRSDLRAGAGWQGGGSARANPAHAPGQAGGVEFGGGAASGGEQRERGTGEPASPPDL